MTWVLLVLVAAVLGALVVAGRRHELARMRGAVVERERSRALGGEALLHFPLVDLSRCLGCGTCVAACPEEGVLELVHGQAAVVRGARCVGHAACERECPVGAITVTIANLEARRDVPVVDERLEAVGAPGIFLAGEVTAHALVKAAVEQGTAVAAEVARRVRDRNGAPRAEGELDLVVVGAGPAGLAASLEAKRQGLSFATLEQERSPGGTVAKYPRRKLVVTQPLDMPLVGRLDRTEWAKEELVDLWQAVVEREELPIRCGETLRSIERDGETFVVRATGGELRARHVCLALGRRGSPRRLGVPGEDLPKVAYSLLDARSYAGRRVLVVGGGDAAVEAALALAEQPGNEVALSYRRAGFFRLRARNQERLDEAVAQGRVTLLLRSRVLAIAPRAVRVAVDPEDGDPQTFELPNDEVFVLAGGTPPVELLEKAGVSLDPSLRSAASPRGERGTGLAAAVRVGLALAVLALLFAVWNADYYALPGPARPAHEKHAWLRPGRGLGLWLGIAALALVAANLAYLLRRAQRVTLGSLTAWMTSHVATGVLAFLCATLHAAMAPRDTVGGRAYWALAVLLATGAAGRYVYAHVPRAANGRELELSEVRRELARLTDDSSRGERRFRQQVREEVEALVEARQWRAGLLGRLAAFVRGERDLRRLIARVRREGREQGVSEEGVRGAVLLARRAHGLAVAAAHYEDLRAVLSSWRFFHRWVALLLVLLVAVHVAYALVYGDPSLDPTRFGGLAAEGVR